MKGRTPRSLIPVLVTGIQRAQVLGRRRLISTQTFIHGADAPWLDSCDKHRNEGVLSLAVAAHGEAFR
ncbi:Hypothetical protein NGAL_HAMBI1146_25940 [Neorhizobium galegae bv. officinalis]|nr:Hypothetical protein NGAL_HAMBI1146_25940 [Neorhizobium galegae bv. officinalis]